MTNRKLRRRGAKMTHRSNEAGQAIVELALTASLLIVLLLGAVQFGRLAYASIEVSNAARAAVAYGCQSHAKAADTTGIQLAATQDAKNITLGTTSVSTACVCSDGTASTCKNTDCSTSQIEQVLTVQTQVLFNPLIHLPWLPATFTLHGKAVQKVLQ